MAFGLFLTVVHAFFTQPRILLPAYVRPNQPLIPWPMHTNMIATEEQPVVTVDTVVKKSNGVSSLPLEIQTVTEQFIEAWRNGLQGDQILLNTMVKPSTRWENPFVATGKELIEGLIQFSGFFGEPSLTVFNVISKSSRQIEISYHLSFWYPVGWRPRIIIPGKALVTISDDLRSIQSVQESWDVSVTDIALKQFLPRWWDVLHVFSSPSPEYPPIKTIASVGKVNFVELPKTVVVEVRWSGSAKFPGPPLLAVPGFSLFGYLKTSNPNRDPFYTSLPVEVQSGTTYLCSTYLFTIVSHPFHSLTHALSHTHVHTHRSNTHTLYHLTHTTRSSLLQVHLLTKPMVKK